MAVEVVVLLLLLRLEDRLVLVDAVVGVPLAEPVVGGGIETEIAAVLVAIAFSDLVLFSGVTSFSLVLYFFCECLENISWFSSR